VPGEVQLPQNLFIIGTVNVDETTYMFSPKVLDRANVLEFRVAVSNLKNFLEKPAAVDFTRLDAAGAEHGKRLTALTQQGARLADTERRMFEAELLLFFEALQAANSEFGFRVAKEGASFLHFHKLLSGPGWEFKAAMDAQILQKLLPKLHGSRNTLEPVLCTLATLCFANRTWELGDGAEEFAHLKGLRAEAAKAARMEDESLDPLGLTPEGKPTYPPGEAYYRLSFEKVVRMLDRLRSNGFTSFAEA
jgi:5-methylcytosine-specific restriction endonuclease McrBC GTP-binding regulatory subunit McrB